MSENKIVDKILKSAEADARRIEEETDERIKIIEEKLTHSKKSSLELIEAQKEKSQKEVQNRFELTYRLEVRKLRLAKKRALIDQAFDEVQTKLNQLNGKAWGTFLGKIIINNVETGKEVLMVPEKDHGLYKDGGENAFLEKINQQLEKMGKTGELKLSQKFANFDNGVLIVSEVSDINLSFERLIKESRKKYEAQVANKLFDSEG